MFDRFTAGAHKVVARAQDEALHFNHNYIGTEHILLGLLKENGGIATRVLRSRRITMKDLRDQVESIIGYGDKAEATGQAPFTPRAKQVFENALREALGSGVSYVGTEHILIGLIQEDEGVGARVLKNLEVDPEDIHRAVIWLARGPKEEAYEEEELSTHEVAVDVAERIALALERIAAALEEEE